MALINIPAFSGLNILAAPQRIEEHQATVAVGCDFRSLDLRPFKGDNDIGQVTTNTSGIANGATLYQVDTNIWLGLQGDKSVARSPALLSGSAIAQRVFVADNEGPTGTEWDWVRDVPVSAITNATLTGNEKRLGVPKPAAIVETSSSNEDLLARVEQSGAITSLQIHTRLATSTKKEFDSRFTFAADAALKTGDNVLVDIPGMAAGPWRLESDGSQKVIMRRSGAPWLVMNAPLLINTAGDQDRNIITFKKSAHGMQDGDQVVVNYNTTSQITASSDTFGITRWRIYTVANQTVDSFTLQYPVAGELVALRHTATGTARTDFKLRVARIAREINALPDNGTGVTFAWRVQVGTEPARSNYVLTYSPSEDTPALWSYASTIDTVTDRAYCITYVNEFGDESEPSFPTKTMTVVPGSPVTFRPGSITATAPSTYSTPVQVRLYRTDATGAFRLVTTETPSTDKIPYATLGTANPLYIDTKLDTELGEPLATQGWQIPPKDLNGLLVTPGGSLIGHNGRTVYGSVPYAPYAFPLANQVAFDYTVVGMVATSAGIVVVTEGNPALIVGDDPSTWSIQKLEYPYGCVSRRSIVDMGEMAIYASADGLVGVAGANVEILTKDVMTRAQWNDLYSPGNIRAAHAEGRYYGATKVGSTYKAFMFDPRTRTFINFTADQTNYTVALYTRLSDDTLLIMRSNGRVYEWNRGTDEVPYLWRSKAFQLPKPDIFGCAQLIAPAAVANKPITLRLIAWDGEIVYTLAAFSNLTGSAFTNLAEGSGTLWESDPPRRLVFNKNINPFRLPMPNNRYTVYYVELEGTLPMAQVTLASVMDEIKQV